MHKTTTSAKQGTFAPFYDSINGPWCQIRKEIFHHGREKTGRQGAGTIRQRTDSRWEARFVVGIDSGTGKDIRRSVYAATQREARRKMTEAIAALDRGTYKDPCRMTLGEWLDIWSREYLNSVKPTTAHAYRCIIQAHIRPRLSAVKLEQLNVHTIQQFYNSLADLSPKTVKNIHGVLHKALQQATVIGYMTVNPSDSCSLPRVERPELQPLDEEATGRFVEAIKGQQYEAVFLFALFTGARQGEILGLTWDCVDLTAGTVTISKQLQNIYDPRDPFTGSR